MDKVTLVDKNDKVLGFLDKNKAHKNPVALHRAISVLIFNKKGNMMLIQKRTERKKTWPLFWTNTTCTNVKPNETYKNAATRRLKEEMGIRTSLKESFNFQYKAKYNDVWGENEVDHVFIGVYEGKIMPDPEEAAGYEWIDIKDLKKDVKKNPNKYTPWFKIILKKLKD